MMWRHRKEPCYGIRGRCSGRGKSRTRGDSVGAPGRRETRGQGRPCKGWKAGKGFKVEVTWWIRALRSGLWVTCAHGQGRSKARGREKGRERFLETLIGGTSPRLGAGRVKAVSRWAQQAGWGPSPADKDYQRRSAGEEPGSLGPHVWLTGFSTSLGLAHCPTALCNSSSSHQQRFLLAERCQGCPPAGMH